MPRTARMVIPDEQAVYHVMSCTALDKFPIGSVEKDYLLKLIKRFSMLYFTEIVHWGQQRTPVSVQNTAAEMVNWNTYSIVDAIRRQST